MTAVNVSSLQYFPVGPKGSEWAAQFSCASGDTTTINLRNNQSVSDRAVNLRFAVVDNIGNSGLVSIVMGNLTFSVPPFTRETYALPEELTTMQITPGSGAVTVTVSESRLVSDQTNSLAVQQTAAATLTYQFIGPYALSQNQASTDVNKTALFNPTVADISYNLILGSSAGNGWLEFVYNFGTKNVVLTPTVGNTINGAASLTLAPNAAGYIQSDGANWYANLKSQGDFPLLGGGSLAAGTGALAVDLSALVSTYSRFKFIANTIIPSISGSGLRMQISNTGGAPFSAAANYRYSLWATNSVGGSGVVSSAGNTFIDLVNGITAGTRGNIFSMELTQMGDVGRLFSMTYEAAYDNANLTRLTGGADNSAIAAVNAFQMFMSAGNFTSMEWSLYGYK